MKIFISWSGDHSRKLAEAFCEWVPNVIQVVQPYYTPNDIDKGSKWLSEISNELKNSKFGLFFLTKDNLNSNWIMFEAGCISNNMDGSKVCPILFNMEPTDLKGPLQQFQSAKFNKADIKKVLLSIYSEAQKVGLRIINFENVFEKWWPDLEKKINPIILQYEPSDNDIVIRDEKDILEEILSLSRDISRSIYNKKIYYNGDLVQTYKIMFKRVTSVLNEKLDPEYNNKLYNSLNFILSRRLNRGVLKEFEYIELRNSISPLINNEIDLL